MLPSKPLEYACDSTAPRRFSLLARIFITSGLIALACIPTTYLFEYFHWFEGPVHLTSFIATTVCFLSALRYILTPRHHRPPQTHHIRFLAWTAIILAGGFLLLIAVVLSLLTRFSANF